MQPKFEIPKELMEQMEAAKPSADPAYWAKSACTTCHGRGEIPKLTVKLEGDNVFSQNGVLCSCARNRFRRWQQEWLAAHQPVTPARVSIRNEQAPVAKTVGRLDRLDDQIVEMKAEVAKLIDGLDQLPVKLQLDELTATIASVSATMTDTIKVAEQKQQQADELTRQAHQLRSQATALEGEVRLASYQIVPELQRKLDELRRQQGKARHEFHQRTHQRNRQARVLEAKIGKLEQRRRRIAEDSGLPDVALGLPTPTLDPTPESAPI